MDISLIKDESVLHEVEVRRSYLPFIPSSKFALTTKRILAEYTNVFLWAIPTGNNEITYPLNQVSGVRIDSRFSYKSFSIGLLFILLGIFFLKYVVGIIPIVLGIAALLNSSETSIVVQSTSGAAVSSRIIKADKDKAKEFINTVNNTIAER